MSSSVFWVVHINYGKSSEVACDFIFETKTFKSICNLPSFCKFPLKFILSFLLSSFSLCLRCFWEWTIFIAYALHFCSSIFKPFSFRFSFCFFVLFINNIHFCFMHFNWQFCCVCLFQLQIGLRVWNIMNRIWNVFTLALIAWLIKCGK